MDSTKKSENEMRDTSLKEMHIGYGLFSVQSIADKYDGGVEFTNKANIFHASVMLNPD